MKKIIAIMFLAVTVLSLSAQTDSFEGMKSDIDVFIDSVIKTHNVPGVSIAIVKGDSVIYEKGYGYRDLKEKLPVTEKTLFCIGSSTKAFTATAISIAAERGLLDIDGKVKSYLPDFELADRNVSENATVLDLLTHRIGLPRHDLMWYGSDFSRDEIYKRLKYLPLSKGIRETFQYQNHMFMTAGVLLERVSGNTWEQFVSSEILKPLSMNETNLSTIDSRKASDYSLPYYFDGKKYVQMEFREFPAMGPAGTINSNADDMAKWVIFNLSGGKGLLSEASFSRMVSPQMIAKNSPSGEERSYSSYGMGWFIEYYRGHCMVHHGGNIDGFSALVSFFPYDSFGVVVLSNLNATPVPGIISYYISDRFLNLEPVSWSQRVKESEKESEELNQGSESQRIKNTKPSHGLKEYAGSYENKGYGKMKVTYKNGKLHVKYNALDMDLSHFHYDVFDGKSDLLGGMEMKFRFETASDGSINKVYAPLEMSVDEICFERIAESEFSSEEYLKNFVGQYSLKELVLSVDLVSGKLKLTIPGQPQYNLIPKGKNSFNIENLTGFSVSFEESGGKVTAVNLIQPNGTFKVEKTK